MSAIRHMTGIDAYQLYEERASRPTHTVKVLLLRSEQADPSLDLQALRRHVATRMHLVPALRGIAVSIPGRLFHPAWVDRGMPDLEYHVQSTEFQEGELALEALAGGLASTPLPRDRPLWRLWLVTTNGTPLAVMLQLGHALADGHASARIVEHLFGDENPSDVEPDLPASTIPASLELVRSGLRHFIPTAIGLPSHVLATMRAARTAKESKEHTVPAFSGPSVPWGGRLRAGRAVAWASLSRRDVDAARAALDVTVGELVLAIVSGAVQAHLRDTDTIPERSLTAVVPVGPAEWSDAADGNFHRHTFTTLATNESDIATRVRRISTTMRAARKGVSSQSIALWANWMTYYPLFRATYLISVIPMGRLLKKPPASMIASTVRGPRHQLRVGQMRVVHVYSIGVLAEYLGLNFTVWSYLDDLEFTVCCAADHADLASDLAAGLKPAIDELLASAVVDSQRR